MPDGRPAIPADLKRRVLVEAGHKCAIPQCGQPDVDIAHIDEWSKVRKHEFHNLIALCPNCHRRNSKGEIDRQSLFLYKKLLSDGKKFTSELIENRIDLLEQHSELHASLATGFPKAVGEYSRRSFEIGVLDGSTFFSVGICIFVKKRTVLVPNKVLEMIEEGISHTGGYGVVFEPSNMSKYRLIESKEHFSLLEVDPMDATFIEDLKSKFTEDLDLVKGLFSVEESKVRGQLIGHMGEQVGLMLNPRDTEDLRGAMELQFQDAFVSFRGKSTNTKLLKFWLTPIPVAINYPGAPVFRADGTLIGAVIDFEFIEGETGGRPVVGGLFDFPEFWKDQLTPKKSESKDS